MAGEVVLGYDDSAGAKAALPVAAELAVQSGGTLVICYGYAPPAAPPAEETRAHRDALEELGRQAVERAKEHVAFTQIDAEVRLVDARPVDALLALAEEYDARFIVVGSYGESPLKGAILGSTPHKLVHLSDKPVVVVPAS
jgi:nucleotide-binding universal stress UspA family protein